MLFIFYRQNFCILRIVMIQFCRENFDVLRIKRSQKYGKNGQISGKIAGLLP